MRFDDALKQLDGQSVGGQLIVQREGVNILVGRHHDGQLLVDDNPVARALVDALTEQVDEGSAAEAEARKARKPRAPKSGADTVAGTETVAGTDTVAGTEGVASVDALVGETHNVLVSDEVITSEQVGGAG